MTVTWDEAKDLANQTKHGVSFREASELFFSDADYLEIFDDDHSKIEDRFIAIGPIARGLVLIAWQNATKRRSASSVLGGRPSRSERSTSRTWINAND